MEERLGNLVTQSGQAGSPILGDCLAFLDCHLEEVIELGDHDLFIGRIREGKRLKDGAPMSGFDLGKTYLGKG
jgi:flavin reductase (DIM6/NTAB) family NADH-FMN oxidoreductase RutF